jgi:hypothetical protein
MLVYKHHESAHIVDDQEKNELTTKRIFLLSYKYLGVLKRKMLSVHDVHAEVEYWCGQDKFEKVQVNYHRRKPVASYRPKFT